MAMALTHHVQKLEFAAHATLNTKCNGEQRGERNVNKSDDIKELATALAKAQAKMEAADKVGVNTFYKNSRYATLPTVWDACRKALTDNGLSVVQRMDTSENGMVLESILLHASGQWIASTYPINPVKNDPQGLGSAISYARRYALMALVGVVADDATEDDGNSASGLTSTMTTESRAGASADAGLTRIEHFKAEGREAAEGGSYVLATWWKKLQPSEQRNLAKFKDEFLKPMAEAADKQAAE